MQVQKMDKCNGDDKPKLRRWLRDLNAFDGNHPAATIAAAERTSRENLSDTVESFLADPANAPRGGILWAAVRLNVETLLLGAAYGEVLRAEHRTIRQKAHEDTTVYSERYLAFAKNAYEEPWNPITNQALIALFAEGLLDKRMARDVGVIMRKETLRETINQARSYAGIEASMDLRETRNGDVAAVAPAAAKEAPKTKAAAEEDARFAALSKQIAGRIPRGDTQTSTRWLGGVLQLWQARPLRQRLPGTSPRRDADITRTRRMRAHPSTPCAKHWLLQLWRRGTFRPGVLR